MQFCVTYVCNTVTIKSRWNSVHNVDNNDNYIFFNNSILSYFQIKIIKTNFSILYVENLMFFNFCNFRTSL